MRYNLCSHAQNIIHSAITPHITPDNNHIALSVIDEDTGQPLEYKDLMKSKKYKNVWAKSYANELGRLNQGIRNIPGTNTMFFINKSEIPADRHKDITYG